MTAENPRNGGFWEDPHLWAVSVLIHIYSGQIITTSTNDLTIDDGECKVNYPLLWPHNSGFAQTLFLLLTVLTINYRTKHQPTHHNFPNIS